MTLDENLDQFERWVAGGMERKARARAGLEEHLAGGRRVGRRDAALRAFEIVAKTVVVRDDTPPARDVATPH